MPRGDIAWLALKRAAAKGSAHDWEGTPQGVAGLQAYLADVSDAAKDFEKAEEWFCWAAFERLMARKCCAVWLRATAADVAGKARNSVLAAAEQYARAFDFYDQYRSEVSAGEPTPLTLQERARTPERIAVIAPLLEKGIAAETAGLQTLKEAARTLA